MGERSKVSREEGAQNCGCSPELCCSQFGFCGNTSDYCGVGCQQGPCFAPCANDVSVDEVFTQDFFDGIIRQAESSCTGIGFYSRGAFLEALESYSRFGRIGSVDDSRREIASFVANVTHETGRTALRPQRTRHCSYGTSHILQNSLMVLDQQSPTRSLSRLWCNNDGALDCDGANRAIVTTKQIIVVS
ncbi:hypothetical protein Bca101_046276 [Brassica carinata]